MVVSSGERDVFGFIVPVLHNCVDWYASRAVGPMSMFCGIEMNRLRNHMTFANEHLVVRPPSVLLPQDGGSAMAIALYCRALDDGPQRRRTIGTDEFSKALVTSPPADWVICCGRLAAAHVDAATPVHSAVFGILAC